METVSGTEIVVRGRNVVVPDHYRQHVTERLAKVERYDQKIIRIDVELTHERNPRQSDRCQHVEITCRTRGPAVRSEACAEDFYKSLEIAAERLERRLGTSVNRRLWRRKSGSIAEVAADGMAGGPGQIEEESEEPEGPGRIVRIKDHPAKPMTVDQALFEMELVGHDFYLFSDADTGRPSVVYRRHAFDYGLIRLTD